MINPFKKFGLNKAPKVPYLGVEKAPRPYRDWYAMVVISLVFLISMLVLYGFVVIKVTNHKGPASSNLVENSLKNKPADLDKLVAKIEEKEATFLVLMASSTKIADPSR